MSEQKTYGARFLGELERLGARTTHWDRAIVSGIAEANNFGLANLLREWSQQLVTPFSVQLMNLPLTADADTAALEFVREMQARDDAAWFLA
jgi:hypothetical protein